MLAEMTVKVKHFFTAIFRYQVGNMRNTERLVVADPILERILSTMEKKGVNQQEVTKNLGLGNGVFTR